MAFDWLEYLRFAEELSQFPHASQESYKRSVASRTYYAAYHHTKNYLIRSHQLNGEKHEHIIQALKSHRQKDQKKVGVDLERLKNIRVRADYNPEKFDENLREVIKTASRIIHLVDSFD
ncbi:MAG: HEPN domain-containing protein [Candidatus Cloacimonetes bacterium]|nr:HEPN domain-containing protein [Candidatus Cloacimonadota bacterium]